MLTFRNAIKITLESVKRLGPVLMAADDACGFTLAENIVSPIDVAPFRNSAMDGLAVRTKSIAECNSDAPVTLPIAATVFAGINEKSLAHPQKPMKIMTGAPVPDGYDAVVKFEDVTYDEHHVTFRSSAAVGDNIREPGEDIKRGALLFNSGRTIRALDIGILASIGLERVSVYQKPNVQIVTTGNELVEPGQRLSPGEIYNSNQRTIMAMIGKFCHKVEVNGAVSDDLEELKLVLGGTNDVIISTGGVSAGERDFLINAAEAVGWQTVFHKVSMKPGKPFYFAKRGDQLLFGLPGNPLSAAVTCALFVLPALKKIIGRNDYALKPMRATLQEQFSSTGERTLIWPGTIKAKGSTIRVSFSEKKSSAALSAMLNSDGLIIQPPQTENTIGDVEMLTWDDLLN